MTGGYKYTSEIKTATVTIDNNHNIIFPNDEYIMSASVKFSGSSTMHALIIQNSPTVTFSNFYIDYTSKDNTLLPSNTTVTIYYRYIKPVTS